MCDKRMVWVWCVCCRHTYGKKYEMTLWSLLLLLSSFFVSFSFREQHLCSAAAAAFSSALLIPQTIFLVNDLHRPA